MREDGADRWDQRVIQTFLDLAGALVDFDPIDFLQTLAERCGEMLEIDAAAILLTDQRGSLSVVAASTDEAQQLGWVEPRYGDGPGGRYRGRVPTGEREPAVHAAEELRPSTGRPAGAGGAGGAQHDHACHRAQ